LTRKLRERQLRPHCEPCSSSNGRAHVDIEHPSGVEVQWDWLELADTPWAAKAYVLVGALAHSGRFRAWFSDSDGQAHLAVGIDEVLRRLGGTARRGRVDPMATVINPSTGRLQRSFAPVAKHYGVAVDACPPRHGNRKGVVEKAIDYLTRRWWRTARVGSPVEAQASLDRFCVQIADARPRRDRTVGALADAERLLPLPPAAYPVEVIEVRTVAANALVSLWGIRYSLPLGGHVQIRWRLGTDTITLHARGQLVCTHALAAPGRSAHRAPPRAHRSVGERGPWRVQQRPALQAQGEPATAGAGCNRRLPTSSYSLSEPPKRPHRTGPRETGLSERL
jgi:hypothetical protein